MFKFLKMKKMEYELKNMLYSFILVVMKEQKDIVALIQRLYEALKDVPADELQSEFMGRLAELIHNENQPVRE